MTMAPEDVLLRVTAAAVLGAVVGFERESRGQLAGMRTNALVAAGAALFTLAGAHGFMELPRSPTVDPMRVAAQIVSGIGFIGAGVIVRDGLSVRGVTTAAALWASAALGMTCGTGEYVAATIGLVVLVTVLVGLRAVRDRGLQRVLGHHHAYELEYIRGHGTLAPIVEAIRDAGGRLESITIDDTASVRSVSVEVRARHDAAFHARMAELADLPEVQRVRALHPA